MRLKHRIINMIYVRRDFFVSLYFKLFFSWLPIKKNKIVFINFNGYGYGCNPKYIAEEILKQKLPVEMVWLTMPEFMKPKEFPPQIRLVNYTNCIKNFYELSTAQIWIGNTRTKDLVIKGLRKKTGQISINTWHGSLGIKSMDADVPMYAGDPDYRKLAIKDINMADIMFSNSDFETNIYRNKMWFKNKIIKIGHPRNDIFIKQNENMKTNIKSKLGVDTETNIALYVPSFRDNKAIDCYNLDYELLKQTLESKTGKKWVLLSRFHNKNLYQIQSLNKYSTLQQDVSFYPDIQELLYVSDLIISDYSSCMFDFMLTGRPCFIFATDLDVYKNVRGFCYPIETTPFPIAQTNEELMYNINNFNLEKYQNECKLFLKEKNAFEDGKASERAVRFVKYLLKKAGAK